MLCDAMITYWDQIVVTASSSEASSFGSNFNQMKTAIDQVEWLRNRLHLMGISIDRSTSETFDIDLLLQNSTSLENKKDNLIRYQHMRNILNDFRTGQQLVILVEIPFYIFRHGKMIDPLFHPLFFYTNEK
jgi:hypothetical protein